MKYKRRDFIKISALSLAGSSFFLSCKRTFPGYYFFTLEEALCLIAVCERIIPADQDPGATDAGVIHYIDRQLSDYFQPLQGLYRNGIAALQKSSVRSYGKLFEELDTPQQTELLKNLEQNKLIGEEWSSISQTGFFNNIINHTMQGFYGSPRYGGNKDYAGYATMRLEYPQVIGQNRYR